MAEKGNNSGTKWTFLTNHAHVLLCIAEKPDLRMRDLAQIVGITERAVQKIVADLAEGGYLDVEKGGRCNTYKTNTEKHLRHPIESQHQVADLLRLIGSIQDRNTSE
ncbi:MAG: MarR family transcriptional regulator [Sedimentisphaeraceae bacterium JB056]